MSEHTEQLRDELRRVIDRYSEESDLTICELLGVLELMKQEAIDSLRQYNEDEPE